MALMGFWANIGRGISSPLWLALWTHNLQYMAPIYKGNECKSPISQNYRECWGVVAAQRRCEISNINAGVGAALAFLAMLGIMGLVRR
jgi:hypothetical protein